jgi:hypothetical protein
VAPPRKDSRLRPSSVANRIPASLNKRELTVPRETSSRLRSRSFHVERGMLCSTWNIIKSTEFLIVPRETSCIQFCFAITCSCIRGFRGSRYRNC